MNTICYLVYGSKREYHLELTYSVASLHRFFSRGDSAAWRIVLICDETNRREDLPVEHLTFSPEEFAEWTQNGQYHHAAKVHALIKAVDCYGDNTALIDTDTYFREHPKALFERIGKGRTVMQATDGLLGQFAEWRPLIEATGGDCQGFRVDAASVMLNSGVVGLHALDSVVLPDVLSLMATLYGLEPVFNIEQFAFSAVLGKHTELTTCADIVAHYWGPERRFMHAHIGALFPDFTRDNFDRLAASFVVFGYPTKKRLNQIRARLQALWRRQDGDYRFAYLAYRSAVSCASSNPLAANAWARIAADILQRRRFPAAIIANDFRLMRHQAALGWFSSETSTAWQAVWDAPTMADTPRTGAPSH